MATTYKTPGVYVEEIPKLPPSVAQVETAIPAFIGYTEKAEKNGEPLTNIPTRISSLLEFTTYFGGQRKLDDGSITVTTDEDNNYAVKSVAVTNGKQYYLFDSMRLFFDNGGGDCYIVSVGNYKTSLGADNTVSGTALTAGVQTLEKVDEPTILLFPDAVFISSASESQFYSLQQTALSQCAKLQDRVAVLDLHEIAANVWPAPIQKFRDNIGINNLKYSAAYTPWIYTSYPLELPFMSFRNGIKKKDGVTAVPPLTNLTTDSDLNKLVTDVDASIADVALMKGTVDAICDADNTGTIPASAVLPLEALTIKDRYKQLVERVRTALAGDVDDRTRDLLAFVRNTALRFTTLTFAGSSLNKDLASYAGSSSLWRGAVEELIKIEKNVDVWALTGSANDAAVDTLYGSSTVVTAWLGNNAVSTIGNGGGNAKNYDNNPPGPALAGLALFNAFEGDIASALSKLSAFADTMVSAASSYQKAAQDALYELHPIISNIVKNIKKQLSKIPPSGAVAGIYARVDNARGVWKAPANESINSVSGPSVQISADEQSNLNVDAVAGKSINAIRSFTGKGTLVWGARTLMGNDNEWRYVSVRRFFNMVEESCKKSTEPFVFEPNDANTWVKVQGMIENFLTVLWRQGALQGAKPEHAFYVAVGLGKTMTALDILEGRMIVEIGMAVVRPAEFIILQFSHKMAES
jgi:hypothetical protein